MSNIPPLNAEDMYAHYQENLRYKAPEELFSERTFDHLNVISSVADKQGNSQLVNKIASQIDEMKLFINTLKKKG